MMSNDLAMHLSKSLLWHALLISAPVITVALLAGFIISILQVITQIQDSTLSAVPKLIAVVLTLMLGGEWMLRNMVDYARDTITHIPQVVHS